MSIQSFSAKFQQFSAETAEIWLKLTEITPFFPFRSENLTKTCPEAVFQSDTIFVARPGDNNMDIGTLLVTVQEAEKKNGLVTNINIWKWD